MHASNHKTASEVGTRLSAHKPYESFHVVVNRSSFANGSNYGAKIVIS
jgi:hypothetical protein